jgi:hypothetical protein
MSSKRVKLSSLAILLISVFLMVPETGKAQSASEQSMNSHNSFTVDLEIRPRFEYRNGFKSPIPEGETPAAFTEQRSRVYLGYQASDLELKLTVQDVRIWGDHNQIYKNDPALTNLFEAWASYHFTDQWSTKFGRQALNYDNARFMGDLGWAQQARSHDAFLIRYKNDHIKADAGVTFNQANVFEPTNLTGTFYPLGGNNKSMQYLWVSNQTEAGHLSFLFHNDGRQQGQDDIAWRQTAGVNGSRSLGGITLRGEVYYQFGEDPIGRDVSAYLLNAEASVKANSLILSAGVDLLSGTELNESDNHSFTPLYGTNHKFYGYMDYFQVGNPYAQPGNGLNVGLINTYQKVQAPLSEDLSLNVHLHEFISQTDIFDGQGDEMGSYLGTELDVVLNWSPAPAATFSLGYSQMFATDTMIRIKGDGDVSNSNSWAWVMLRINPRVLEL